MTRVKFRRNSAIAVAGFVAFFGAIPLATARWYLALILLVPLAVGLWGLRSGTDVDASGVSVRALIGHRRLPWSQITGFVRAQRGVSATLVNGATVPLPAVGPKDLPRLVEAGGQELTDEDAAAALPQPEEVPAKPAEADRGSEQEPAQ